MAHTVVFAPEAVEQLANLYHYIAERATPGIAEGYTGAIVSFCEGLSNFPHRGTRRDDIRPGLRATNYKGHAVIAFAVDDANMRVVIVGVFYGGQDYEAVLAPATD